MKSFTLIEILVVISIIGILALLTIPVFKAFQPFIQLNGISQELVGDLRYIQQLTITEQKEYCLQLFPAEKKYQVKKCEEKIIKEKILPEGINFFSISGFTDNEIRYNPYGAVKEAGIIILENIKNKTKTISIKPSGFISVID